MSNDLVKSILTKEEDGSIDQFLEAITSKIEDAIEVKRVELASTMFAESKGECPECGKAKGDCECEDEEDDEEEDDEEDDDEEEEMEDDEDEKEMKEDVEQISEGLQRKNTRALNKLRDASAGAKYKRSGMPVPEPGAQHKTAQAYNKAIGRGLRKMGEEAEQIDELSKGKLVSYVKSAMKNKKPSEKRMQGISTASKKLINMDEMADRVTVDKVTTELGRGKGLPPKVTSKKIVVDKAALLKLGTVQEKAPPGAKYERMVKDIKKGYAKDGLTNKEKAIAYATAWKAKNKEMNEAAMTDTQQMAALGMKGVEKAKTMVALNAYRKHGDINKLSAGHRSLIAGYMEKTGGLAAVNRGVATQALKKERMQE